ncbi:MAG TPA: hypothetical protein VKB19_12305 [Pedobacter sp.]|nr:hypothetical protein [Pedobacter sp.]
MKRYPMLWLSVLALILLAFVPLRRASVDELVRAMELWAELNPQEKVYLHMDKPYYTVGDTIWFKGYVTIGARHQLSKMSGALHVELINESDSLQASLKLPLTAGMAMGDFTIDDTYKQGNYRIRAYTQWMRNADEAYFYDRTFIIGDLLPEKGSKGVRSGKDTIIIAGRQAGSKPPPMSDSDVQFFPEGGNMVNGLTCRVGFKAVYVNGKGLPVKGVVIDESGQQQSSFESIHAGIGVFNFYPQAGKSYQARLSFSDGTEKTVALPVAAAEGYTLSVYQPNKDSVLVRIKSSKAFYDTQQFVGLVVQSGNEPLSSSSVKINKMYTSIWLAKKDFPTGIAQFTLFDPSGQPSHERLAFIRKEDQMKLKLKTDKMLYEKREQVTLDIEAFDKAGKPVAANFSIAVIDETKVPTDERNEVNIFSSLLLSSDLKGYIEQPNFYFLNNSAQTLKAMDNLMLTQGYRRFVWKQLADPAYIPSRPPFKAERLGTEISGRVMTLNNKPVAGGTVTLLSIAQNFIETIKTKGDGKFSFKPIILPDSLMLTLRAVNAKGGKKVEVTLDSIKAQRVGKNKNKPDFAGNIKNLLQVYLDHSKAQDNYLEEMGGMNRAKRLKEVAINARQPFAGAVGNNMNGANRYDQIVLGSELETCPNLRGCVEGKLTGVFFKTLNTDECGPVTFAFSTRGDHTGVSTSAALNSEYGKGSAMLIVLDGKPMHPSDTPCSMMGGIWDYNDPAPTDIRSIEVLRTPGLTNIYGTKGQNGVILINTNRGRTSERYTPNSVNIKPKGFNRAREFYQPKYEDLTNKQLADYRSTVYWNPNVKTDTVGKQKLNYRNGVGPGVYKVVLEGIDAAGDLGRQVYRYEVNMEGRARLRRPADLSVFYSGLVRIRKDTAVVAERYWKTHVTQDSSGLHKIVFDY